MTSDEQMVISLTDKGHWSIRPITWAGIWDKEGRIKETGINHFAITHSKEDAEAIVSALREQQEREQNDPLTLEELRRMGQQAVWWSNTTDCIVSIVIPVYHNEPVWVLTWDTQTDEPWRRKAQRLLQCGYKPYRRPPEE